MNIRPAFLVGLALAAGTIAFLLPPIAQDPAYHEFADGRAILLVPNFWNVVSNLPFLLVAMWGLRVLPDRGVRADAWELRAHRVLLAGLALVAVGSAYYHLRPNNSTLFWDRLPMTIVFMTLLAITIAERVDPKAGRVLLIPLLLAGPASLAVWKLTSDLRAYGLVQFYPMLALPLMLILFPPRYDGTAGIWAMIALYALAKLFEVADRPTWSAAAPLSGHPLKHLAGAAAMLCYMQAVRQRQPVMKRTLDQDGLDFMRFQGRPQK